MKWELIGVGLALISIGVSLMVALPPPWWPKMPRRLVHAGVWGGLLLILLGTYIFVVGVPDMLPESRVGQIILFVIGCVLIAFSAGWYLASGKRTSGEVAEQSTLTKAPTYLRLQFNSPGNTAEVGLSNIWYWYVVTYIKQAHFNKKKEITQSVPGHLLFIVFDKPIDLKQPLIETAGGPSPLYEEKSRSARHLLFELVGDLSGKVITVRAVTRD